VDGAPSDRNLTLENLLPLFRFPAKEAAKRLDIGVTKLKSLCRQFGRCLNGKENAVRFIFDF
jgi:hypothetical protein